MPKLSFVHFAPSTDGVFANSLKRSAARSYGHAKKLIVGKAAGESMENTCTQGPVHARILAWVLKKVVFSLLPSEYRTRAPSVSAPIFSLVILAFIDLCLQILVNATSVCI